MGHQFSHHQSQDEEEEEEEKMQFFSGGSQPTLFSGNWFFKVILKAFRDEEFPNPQFI